MPVNNYFLGSADGSIIAAADDAWILLYTTDFEIHLCQVAMLRAVESTATLLPVASTARVLAVDATAALLPVESAARLLPVVSTIRLDCE